MWIVTIDSLCFSFWDAISVVKVTTRNIYCQGNNTVSHRTGTILSRLQHTATHCNTLEHPATPCNTLQHTATHCNTLQHPATPCNTLQHPATHCNALQRPATPCNTLQHTATPCNTLHHPAPPCNTLQHTYLKDIALFAFSLWRQISLQQGRPSLWYIYIHKSNANM